jgi:hypothetical protein
MRRSMVMDYGMLENLTKTPEYEHIIIGTEGLARDMQKKLTLLGLKVPYLVGANTDRENGILGYGDLAELGDPQKYKFIMCCDTSELNLQMVAQGAVYRFLGKAEVAHPQLFLFGLWDIRYESSKRFTDSIAGNSFITDKRQYVVFGSPENTDDFHIHVLGTCYGCSIVRHSEHTFPKLLHDMLEESGFRNSVFDWAQPVHSVADNISKFIRDISFHRINLLILFLNAEATNPLSVVTKNALSTRAGSVINKPPFYTQYNPKNNEVSNGINHMTDMTDIKIVQQKTLIALAKRHGFGFWDVVSPHPATLNNRQGKTLRGFTPGYLSRQRKRKDMLIASMDSRYTKDYSDTFAHVGDIGTLFMDYAHYSDDGNQLVAERFSADILNEFGKRRKG